MCFTRSFSARDLEEPLEREGDDRRNYGAQTMRLLSAAPQPRPLPAADLERRRPNRILYSGTGL